MTAKTPIELISEIISQKCGICFDELSDKQNYVKTNCQRIFCKECMNEFIRYKLTGTESDDTDPDIDTDTDDTDTDDSDSDSSSGKGSEFPHSICPFLYFIPFQMKCLR